MGERIKRLNRLARGLYSRPTPITHQQRRAIDLYNSLTELFGRSPSQAEFASVYGTTTSGAQHMLRKLRERGLLSEALQ